MMRSPERWFWFSVLGLFAATLGLQIAWFMRPQPADVLAELRQLTTDVRPAEVLDEVRELRREIDAIKKEIETKTLDRFFRVEFESFLKNNPELKPPSVRVRLHNGMEIIEDVP